MKLSCPECGVGFRGKYAPINRGKHRYFKHGIEGVHKKKAREAFARKEAKQSQQGTVITHEERAVENAASWAAGRCETVIQEAAERVGVPTAVIATHVSQFIYHSALRKGMGSVNSLPKLRGKAAA